MTSKLALCKACNGRKKTTMGFVTSECHVCHGIGMVEAKEINHLAKVEEKANGEVINKGKDTESKFSQQTSGQIQKGKKGRPRKAG